MSSRKQIQNSNVICIFGGSFDPFHNGHLAMAEAAHREFGFDKITLMPNHSTYYKERKTEELSDARLEMVRLLSETYPFLAYSDMEIRRGGTTYTIDTVETLLAEDPDRTIYFLLGGDSLAWLDQWVKAEELLRKTHFIAAIRGKVGRKEAQKLIASYKEKYKESDIRLLSIPEKVISSTEIREKRAAGESITGMVPPCVEAYILEKGLYRKKKENDTEIL